MEGDPAASNLSALSAMLFVIVENKASLVMAFDPASPSLGRMMYISSVGCGAVRFGSSDSFDGICLRSEVYQFNHAEILNDVSIVDALSSYRNA